MGCHPNIDYDKFPKQSEYKNHQARVCFNYQNEMVMGRIVRDDHEEPWKTIILLDDGRYILASECQWQPVIKGK